MIKTNSNKLVEFLMQCSPGQPFGGHWKVSHDGVPFSLPSIGGISLNIQVGDSAFGWAGDHLEPGVSCTACDFDNRYKHPNWALQTLCCAGNTAKVVTGEAKGSKGVVLGQHGGSEHVIVDFPKKVKEKLTYDDKIIIKAKGMGLKLIDYSDIKLFSLDPSLLNKMKIRQLKNRTLEVPVTTIIPPQCMGSGIGSTSPERGDYDIMTSDSHFVKKYKLDKIRFGDFVAIMDHDNSYGRAFRKGAITIGIVIHSDCLSAGHGPGVTTLMTGSVSQIKPCINSRANMADILKIGTYKK